MLAPGVALHRKGSGMCHVLIIEDEIIVALELEALLQEGGGTSFSIACTEAEAIEEARRIRPAFISSDVCLDEGKGPTAVAAIHREHGHIPTMYVTASPDDCDGCPPEHVLVKPLQEAKIVALFRRLAPV